MNLSKYIFILLLIFSFLSCRSEIDYSDLSEDDIEREDFDPYLMDISTDEDVEIYLEKTGEYPDGTYCADVEYYNPKTGTRSNYDLDVDVNDGNLEKINFPKGGWLDETHFETENISSGEVSILTDKGYTYTVTLTSFGGGCYGKANISYDIQKDLESIICPKCDGEKSKYDELCDDCQDELDYYTCKMCGDYKVSMFDDYCYICQSLYGED